MKVARPELPALTGLRFFAALFILGNHLLLGFVDPTNPYLGPGLGVSGRFGMDLFFVLSGFIIHYNYGLSLAQPTPESVWTFLVARFARLYPLYIFVIAVEFLLSWLLNETSAADRWAAFPYLLTMTQSWFFVAMPNGSIMAQAMYRSSLAWSISTEFFLYLIYPALAYVLARDHSSPRLKLFFSAIATVGLAMMFSDIIKSERTIEVFAQDVLGLNTHAVKHFTYPFATWLFFFSPYGRALEFLIGALVAHSFLSLQTQKPTPIAGAALNVATLAALAYIIAMLLPASMRFDWFEDINNIAVILVPFAVIIFVCAWHQTNWLTKALSWPPLVQLGEYSYSIYLLQLFVFWAFVQFFGMNDFIIEKIVITWGLLILISSQTYRFIEQPARRYVRNLLTIPQRQSAAIAIKQTDDATIISP